MFEDPSVLSTNAAFYNAFASGDMQAMEDIRVKETQPACTYPGWAPLVGRKQVIKSWRNILGDSSAASIKCTNTRAFIYSDCAYVICQERLEFNVLVATNIF